MMGAIHWKTVNITLLVGIISCLSHCCDGAGYNETCDTTNSTCGDNQQCSQSESVCECVPGFSAMNSVCTNIDDCTTNPCENGGSCTDGVNSYTCNCLAGYTGENCTTNINECNPNPCQNIGSCTDGVNSFSPFDINECNPNPCQNGGGCTDGVNSFSCTCAAGYTGTTCDTNIDECDPNPCQNSGSCTDAANSFTCTCAAGYTGTICDTNIDECDPNPCQNSGSCTDGVNSFSCTCAAGYTGTTCDTNINECDPNPCQNSGSCTDGVNSFSCTCAAGYTGTTCTTNINECNLNPCQNGGACTDGINSFSCTCAAGYTGTTCVTNINECNPNPCQSGGVCTDGVNSFSCTCAAGYTGTTCVTNINDCNPNTCQNGGGCTDGVNSFSCTCAVGYTGTTCDTNIDDCKPNPCQNGGSCTDGVNTHTCNCLTGISGSQCETKAPLGGVCSNPSILPASCSASNAQCTSIIGGTYSCECMSEYYDGNRGTGGGSCYPKKVLAENCPNPSTTGVAASASCSDINADCTHNNGYTCQCKTGYYNEAGTCQPNTSLGKQCTVQVDECTDSTTFCNSVCTCNTNHYDDNGFTAGGYCKPISDLKVNDITFSSISTERFVVSWTTPSDKTQFVSNYIFEWSPLDNTIGSGGSRSLPRAAVSETLSSLTSGRAYEVTVESRNNQTQTNSERTTSNSKQQATKPVMPGSIVKDSSNLDADNNNIHIVWNAPSTGVVGGYDVRILDGFEEKANTTVSFTFATLTFSTIKHGHKYIIKITSMSQPFDGGIVELSETYTEEIQTVVKVVRETTSNNTAAIVGAVLGCIIVILVITTVVRICVIHANKKD